MMAEKSADHTTVSAALKSDHFTIFDEAREGIQQRFNVTITSNQATFETTDKADQILWLDITGESREDCDRAVKYIRKLCNPTIVQLVELPDNTLFQFLSSDEQRFKLEEDSEAVLTFQSDDRGFVCIQGDDHMSVAVAMSIIENIISERKEAALMQSIRTPDYALMWSHAQCKGYTDTEIESVLIHFLPIVPKYSDFIRALHTSRTVVQASLSATTNSGTTLSENEGVRKSSSLISSVMGMVVDDSSSTSPVRVSIDDVTEDVSSSDSTPTGSNVDDRLLFLSGTINSQQSMSSNGIPMQSNSEPSGVTSRMTAQNTASSVADEKDCQTDHERRQEALRKEWEANQSRSDLASGTSHRSATNVAVNVTALGEFSLPYQSPRSASTVSSGITLSSDSDDSSSDCEMTGIEESTPSSTSVQISATDSKSMEIAATKKTGKARRKKKKKKNANQAAATAPEVLGLGVASSSVISGARSRSPPDARPRGNVKDRLGRDPLRGDANTSSRGRGSPTGYFAARSPSRGSSSRARWASPRGRGSPTGDNSHSPSRGRTRWSPNEGAGLVYDRGHLGVSPRRNGGSYPSTARNSSVPSYSRGEERGTQGDGVGPGVGSGGDGLRYIVIDGSNVAMSHGNNRVFSVRGIEIVINYFLQRGHTQITAWVPQHRRQATTCKNPGWVSDRMLLEKLSEEGHIKFSPSRRVGTRNITPYDDRYILNLAAQTNGIVISNDNYQDLQREQRADWQDIFRERILQYSFVGDIFMPPEDPLGRTGPGLDDFLRLPRDMAARGQQAAVRSTLASSSNVVSSTSTAVQPSNIQPHAMQPSNIQSHAMQQYDMRNRFPVPPFGRGNSHNFGQQGGRQQANFGGVNRFQVANPHRFSASSVQQPNSDGFQQRPARSASTTRDIKRKLLEFSIDNETEIDELLAERPRDVDIVRLSAILWDRVGPR